MFSRGLQTPLQNHGFDSVFGNGEVLRDQIIKLLDVCIEKNGPDKGSFQRVFISCLSQKLLCPQDHKTARRYLKVLSNMNL